MQTYFSLLDQNAFEALPTPVRASGNTQDVFIVGSLEASWKTRERNDARSTLLHTLPEFGVILQPLLGHDNRDGDVVIAILQIDPLAMVLKVFDTDVLVNELHINFAILTPGTFDCTAVDKLQDAGDVRPLRKVPENNPTRRSSRDSLGCHLLLQVKQTDLLHEISRSSNTSGSLGRGCGVLTPGGSSLLGTSGGLVICVLAFASSFDRSGLVGGTLQRRMSMGDFILGSSRNKRLGTRIDARVLQGNGGTRGSGTRSSSLLVLFKISVRRDEER